MQNSFNKIVLGSNVARKCIFLAGRHYKMLKFIVNSLRWNVIMH